MTTDEIDLVDKILGPAASAPAGQSVSPGSTGSESDASASISAGPSVSREFNGSESDSPVGALASATPSGAPVVWSESESPASASVSVVPKRRFHLRNPLARAKSDTRRRFRPAWFVVAFGVGTLVSFFLFAAVALGLSSYYSSRVIPGVHVGSVDVSGLSRDEVIAKLQTDYAYLGQGEVTVTTPVGTATITYQQAGRGPDLEVMADAAMSAGHTGSPFGDAASVVRSTISGQVVPVVVRLDPMSLATRIHPLVGTSVLPPQNAHVTLKSGKFTVSPSTGGFGIDELAISRAIVDKLTQPDAPADLQAGGTYVALNPQVNDTNAQNAITAAQKMTVDVALVWSGAPKAQSPAPSASASPGESASPTPTPTPTPTPAPSQPQTPPKTFTIDAQTIRGWIVFGAKPDGSYGPAIDPALVQAYLFALSPKVAIAPVEPWVVYNSSGAPASLKGGKDGASIDVAATSQAIEAYLDSLVSSENPGSSVAIVTVAIPPQITLDSLSGMVKIGEGSWTTTFYPDISNGNGANIRTPAKLLNGQVVNPGQQFSFLQAVGPIDSAHGYTMGGVIKGGKSDHTGAMGGGICSASTTMFNAASRAGLQIDERHAHFYYIYRYPVGLDATVYSDGVSTWDLKWTNDTPNPILIRGYSTYGSKSTITIELWSRPIDRKVTFSPEFKANIVQPGDSTVYVTNLKPGQQNRAEYPTIGFSTSRTRTVTDSSGKVIHTDTWNSSYTKVDGILQIGVAPAPPPPPPPAPTPVEPPPAPTPAPLALSPAQLRP
jgi:vancomycin resistance protein YoaR